MTEGHFAALAHGAPLAVGETVVLCASVAAGLRFRQVNPKEAFTVGDAQGRYFRASLVAYVDGGVEAKVYESMPDAPESPVAITLVCAVLQRQRMLWVCQKAAELGVARVQPVFTLKSVQADGLAHEKAHAWQGQALKGARQCRRGSVPEVGRAVTLDAWTATDAWRSADARWFLDDRAESGTTMGAPKSVMLVIGPEGGFANVERERMMEAGARPLKLGGRVLRAETAVMAGLVVVQHRVGDMGL